jgi:serine/threonine protein kinase
MSDVEPWPPNPPNMSVREVVQAIESRPFALTSNSQIWKVKNSPIVFKDRGSQREWTIQMLAGDCAIKPHGRVLQNQDGTPVLDGFLMDLAAPLDCASLAISEHELVMRHTIYCVETLHSTYKIIHGDIKPDNMLRCSDGRVRLCDFAEARKVDEDPAQWEGTVTVNYLAPYRCHFYPDQ